MPDPNWSPWIENYVTGERFRFWRGELPDRTLRNQLWVEAGNKGVPAHIHKHADERFTVEVGVLGYRAGKDRGTLRAGESRVLPKGVAHTWWNAGDTETLVTVDWIPGDRGEESLRRMCTVMNTMHAKGRKMTVLHAIIVLDAYSDVLAVPGPMGSKPVVKTLVLIANVFGFGWVRDAPLATHETAPVSDPGWQAPEGAVDT